MNQIKILKKVLVKLAQTKNTRYRNKEIRSKRNENYMVQISKKI